MSKQAAWFVGGEEIAGAMANELQGGCWTDDEVEKGVSESFAAHPSEWLELEWSVPGIDDWSFCVDALWPQPARYC